MIRGLRRRQRLSLSKIAEVLPEILANRTLGGVQEPLVGGGPQTSVVAERILDVAIEAFGLHSYGEVSIAGLPQPIDMHVAAEICAWALRPGLPVLLELAKRSMLFEPEYVSEARDTFRLLAAEMGEILLPGVREPRDRRDGDPGRNRAGVPVAGGRARRGRPDVALAAAGHRGPPAAGPANVAPKRSPAARPNHPG